MTGLIAVLEIPVLIILVNRAAGAAWNYYTISCIPICFICTAGLRRALDFAPQLDG